MGGARKKLKATNTVEEKSYGTSKRKVSGDLESEAREDG